MIWGKLYGIGIGPGDPELLTVKAVRILKELDVLIIPKSKKGKRSLAFSIVTKAVDKQWEVIELILPMIKDKEELSKHWDKGAGIITEVLKSGKDAGFITLGDPSVYSTFTYLTRKIKAINPETPVEIIPGISAINSIAAKIGQPLAEGKENLLIVPADSDQGFEKYLGSDWFDNIVFMKAGNSIPRILQSINSREKPLSAFLISRCGFEDEICTDDLHSVVNENLDYLSTIIVKGAGEGSND